MKARYTRDDLVAKLEELHMLVIEADAFYVALDAAYSETAWPSNDPARRRTLNHLECYGEELRKRLDLLLRESRDVVGLAMAIVKRSGNR